MMDKRNKSKFSTEIYSKYFTEHKGITVLIKIKVKIEKLLHTTPGGKGPRLVDKMDEGEE